MAFTNSNDYLTGRKPVVYPAGAEVVAVRFPIDLVAADLDANDVGSVAILPAGCVPLFTSTTPAAFRVNAESRVVLAAPKMLT
jgi:hypothetical protein